MATYREKFHRSTDWKTKVHVMELFHLLMLSRHKKAWHLDSTAKYFGVSIALVSENLHLASRIDELDDCPSRVKALAMLRKIRRDS